MMGLGSPDKETKLYIELYISTYFLNCTHAEFKKLPKIEKTKLFLFYRSLEERIDFSHRQQSKLLKDIKDRNVETPKLEQTDRGK